jgi:hypothetical protein
LWTVKREGSTDTLDLHNSIPQTVLVLYRISILHMFCVLLFYFFCILCCCTYVTFCTFPLLCILKLRI